MTTGSHVIDSDPMPDNSIRLKWTDEESESWRACQRVIREAAVLASGEPVHGGRELLAGARIEPRKIINTTMLEQPSRRIVAAG